MGKGKTREQIHLRRSSDGHRVKGTRRDSLRKTQQGGGYSLAPYQVLRVIEPFRRRGTCRPKIGVGSKELDD